MWTMPHSHHAGQPVNVNRPKSIDRRALADGRQIAGVLVDERLRGRVAGQPRHQRSRNVLAGLLCRGGDARHQAVSRPLHLRGVA